MQTATIQAEVDYFTKIAAESVLGSLGVDPAEAIRLFYRQVVNCNGMPFAMGLVPKKTAHFDSFTPQAVAEIFARDIPSVQAELRGDPGLASDLLSALLEYKAEHGSEADEDEMEEDSEPTLASARLAGSRGKW